MTAPTAVLLAAAVLADAAAVALALFHKTTAESYPARCAVSLALSVAAAVAVAYGAVDYPGLATVLAVAFAVSNGYSLHGHVLVYREAARRAPETTYTLP